MPIICRKVSVSDGVMGGRDVEGFGGEAVMGKRKGKDRGEGVRTLEARAEGSLMLPKSSVALARSASLTFW